MVAPTRNAYDEVPYPDRAVDFTHPGRLAMLAQLFGMAPAPVERCRVLELGCAAGGNLLPLAELFPESTFVGVDRAASAIAKGRAWAERLDVGNLALVEADLTTYDPGPEPFDYIVAHGVYSWVPDPVRERVMAIFGRALAPNGVAYVSYNALPGSYLRRAVRDMMFFHTRGLDDPKRVAEARALTAFLAEAVPEGVPVYKAMMVSQRDRIAAFEDEYLVHDDLAEHKEPFYFHQVIEHAGRHGLAYLAEARFAEMSAQFFPRRCGRCCAGWATSCRSSNTSTSSGGAPSATRCSCATGWPCSGGSTAAPSAARSRSRPRGPSRSGPISCRTRQSTSPTPAACALGLETPFTKAAMTALAAAAPRALSFDELLSAARARVGSAREEDATALGELPVGGARRRRMVDLHAHRPRMAASPVRAPRWVTRIAREQAAAGEPVTTLYHQNVRDLDPFARRVLTLLDGTRDRAALVAAARGEAGERGPVEAALVMLVEHAFIVG